LANSVNNITDKAGTRNGAQAALGTEK